MIARYTRPQMAKIWSDENRMRAMMRVEETFLEVLSEQKEIPPREMKALRQLMQKSLVESTRGKESSSGHEVIGMLQAVSSEISEQAPNLGKSEMESLLHVARQPVYRKEEEIAEGEEG